MAIQGDKYGFEGRAECAAVLRAAGAKESADDAGGEAADDDAGGEAADDSEGKAQEGGGPGMFSPPPRPRPFLPFRFAQTGSQPVQSACPSFTIFIPYINDAPSSFLLPPSSFLLSPPPPVLGLLFSASILVNERGNYASSSVLYFFPAVFTGEADVLLNMCMEFDDNDDPVKPDINKFNALIKAGAPIRTTVRRNYILGFFDSPLLYCLSFCLCTFSCTHMQYTAN